MYWDVVARVKAAAAVAADKYRSEETLPLLPGEADFEDMWSRLESFEEIEPHKVEQMFIERFDYELCLIREEEFLSRRF